MAVATVPALGCLTTSLAPLRTLKLSVYSCDPGRPDASRCWNFINSFREDHPEWTSLPGLFLQAPKHSSGRDTLSIGAGKAYHPMVPPDYDGNRSWSGMALPFVNPCFNTAATANASCRPKSSLSATISPVRGAAPIIPPCDGGLPCPTAFCPIDISGKKTTVANEFCEVDALEDTKTVEAAIGLLRKAHADNAFFYLAVGLHKPHMPWQAAAEDWAQHPLQDVDLPAHQEPPVGMPPIAFHMSEGCPTCNPPTHPNPYVPLPAEDVRKARRAYRAAITGMDRKLGVLVQELDTLALREEVAIVIHGDHGWQLGEHGAWRKFTNFELATRVPLIIAAPWIAPAQQQQRRTNALVELIDLAPTIAELAGVPLPAAEKFDGTSLVPLLSLPPTQRRKPAESDAVTSAVGWSKDAAFSQYPKKVQATGPQWEHNGIIHSQRETFTHMGMSIRVDGWRLTQWVLWNQTSLRPMWAQPNGSSGVVATELYDHRATRDYPTDFNQDENVNVANLTQHAALINALSTRLQRQFIA